MTTTMDQLHQAQLDLQKKIANSYENFRSRGDNHMTRGQVQSRLEALEKHAAQFQKNHKSILNLPNLDANHLYFTTKLLDLVEDSYYLRKGDYADFIMELDKREATTAPPQVNVNNEATQQLQLNTNSFLQSLPKMDLPTFTGQYSEWQNFRDMFCSLIHRRTDMPGVMKLYFLRTHVTGEPLDMIKG